ncbi:hypothetical protein E2C01_102131 [Portunus trituberculatus]|uniref:Uncharacterized protein n=1 Tax=Portunus trituberculatus TaxID=210409 RepID=A0A5B7KNH5_PORTR|nr:hypothetical protein [Portunus trituberculatus]
MKAIYTCVIAIVLTTATTTTTTTSTTITTTHDKGPAKPCVSSLSAARALLQATTAALISSPYLN